MLCIGIDISKARFDCALFIEKGCQKKSFSNNKGFRVLFKWLKGLDATQERVFCMEVTGVYEVLWQDIYISWAKVIVVNPIKPHAFTKMEMMRNKTDKADAISIARYCQYIVAKGELEKNLLWDVLYTSFAGAKNLFKPKSEAVVALQCLVTRLEQLGKQLTQENNRLPVSLNKVASKSIKSMIRHIRQQDRLGYSRLSGGCLLFKSSKQVASFAGLNPKITQSGGSINKSSLSKMGHKRIRKALDARTCGTAI